MVGIAGLVMDNKALIAKERRVDHDEYPQIYLLRDGAKLPYPL